MAFVGRTWERAELTHLLAEARAGRGALVLIGGEAGVGKTAMIGWALDQAATPEGAAPPGVAVSGEGVQVGTPSTALGRCPGPGETPLYGPWRELAAQVTGVSWPAPLQPAGVRGPGLVRGPGETVNAVGDPTGAYELAAALARAVRTAGRTLVMGIEDLQWADRASVELLRHLAGHVQRLPLLLLVTYRPAEAGALRDVVPDIQRAGALRLSLERFTQDEVADLAAATLPEHPGTAIMARYLHQRTGGHPLFTGELLGAVRAGGLPEGPLPETVQQAIDQQLNRLAPEALPTLQAAAVIGQRFAYDLLVQVADGSEAEVLDALEAAVTVRLVREERQGGLFTFDHDLVREVLLARLMGPRLRRWHLRAAEALMAGGGLETVASHLERAGDPRAVASLLQLGDRALRLGARAEAVARYEQVLDLLAKLPAAAGGLRAETLLRLAHAEVGARARQLCDESLAAATRASDTPVATWARYCKAAWHAEDGHPGALVELQAVREAQEGLIADARYQHLEVALYGEALAYPRVHVALAVALTKAGQSEEARELVREMQARTRPGDGRTPILRAQWWIASLTGRWEDALELGQRLSEALMAAGDDRAAFWVESNRVYHVLLCKADQPEAVDSVTAQMLRLGERVAAVSGQDPLADGHPPLGWYAYLRGDWETARHHLLGYLERHPGDADPGVRGFAVLLQLAQGNTAGARATLFAVPPLHPDEEPGLHMVQISAYTMRAELCLAERDVDGARAWLDAAVRYQRQRGGTAFQASVRLTWARFHLGVGDLKAAYAEATQALEQAQSPREFRALLSARRMLGEVTARLGRMDEAAAHLQEARSLAQQCNYPYEAALAALVQAEVLHRAGVDLRSVRATFAHLGALPALARLDAVLATGGAGGLSARELEVVRLVARGLTDKEVAAELFISPHTVDGHLRRIFARLGTPSRTALAAIAARQGWV